MFGKSDALMEHPEFAQAVSRSCEFALLRCTEPPRAHKG